MTTFEKEYTNRQRLVKHLMDKEYIKSPQDFDNFLKVLPEKSRNILKSRWGIEDGKYCPNFRQFGSKLGIPVAEAELLYHSISKDMRTAIYTSCLEDYSDFTPEKACLVGRLIYEYRLLTQDRISNGKHLLSIINGDYLTEREKIVLTIRYGLEDGRFKTMEEVGATLNVTRERIRQIQAKAFLRIKCYYHR